MKNTLLLTILVAAISMASVQRVSATLMAEFLFNQGTGQDTAGGTDYSLAPIGAAPSFAMGIGDNSSLAYLSDGNVLNHLFDPAIDGSPKYTVSVWAYTSNVSQANGGIFANNNAAGAGNSWGLSLDGGNYVLNAKDGFGPDVLGAAMPGVWHNLVVSKGTPGGNQIWFDGVLVDSNIGYNPGGLQNFFVGRNRTGGSFDGYIDTIQIWNGENVSGAVTYATGNIPDTGSTLALLGLMAGGVACMRRKFA